jgi:uncharacterized protein YjiK
MKHPVDGAELSFRPIMIHRPNLILSTLGISALTLPLHAQLLVTEIQSDGLSDFWELTNVGASAVDLSGYKWDDESRNPADGAAVTIPAGTMIASGESIIFTATAATTFRTQWGLAGNVQVIVGGPGFGQGDGVALFDSSNTELFFYSYASGGFTRSSGLVSSGGHAGISAGGVARQSAIWDPTFGTSTPRYTNATGSNFNTVSAPGNSSDKGSPGYSGFGIAAPSVTLFVSATPASFSESAANPASTGTVVRRGDTTAELVVNLSSSDATEATVPATVTIPIGAVSASFDISAVNDTFPDGSKSAIITASASGANAGTTTLTVSDDGDILDTDFLLTELQSDQSSGSPANSEDYWELTNIGSSTRDIGGYSWHDSGRSGSAASAYKLPPGTMIAPSESVIFTVMPATDFRNWWNIPGSVQVFQTTGAPGLGKGDGVSFFDPGQNELFFFSYAVAGFTREDGSPAIGENPSNPNDVTDPGHAGIAAGGTAASQAVIWVPDSGTLSPRYSAASGSNYGSFQAAIGTDLGSPGGTIAGPPSVSIADASIVEGNSGTTTLALDVTRSDTATAFTIDYAVTGGTADSSDFTLTSGTLNFTVNGPATLPINISVNGDTELEDDETVIVTLSNVSNTIGSTVLVIAEGTATIINDETAAGTINLATYLRTGRYNLPEPTRTALPPGTAPHNLLCQEASAVTYNWDTDTLFISCDGGRSVTQVSKTGALIDTMSLALQAGAPQGTAFYDPEGITYIGNGQFVMSEERDQQLVKFTYAAGTTLTRAAATTVDLGPFDDNTGTEGLSWDPPASDFIVLKEKNPIGVFLAGVDFTAGTSTTAPPVVGNESSNLFNTSLLGMTDVADVFAFSNLPAMAGQPQEGNLLILGQEDARLVNISRSGVIASTLNITAEPGDTISSPNMQHEGVTMDRDGHIYIVNENGGGDINFPQLWVYSPSITPNAAPAAVVLNNAVTSLEENTSTASPVKLADIVVTDDGLGINELSLSGADAASFEIIASALYLKAGVTLDFESKTSYAVTINVDDASLGASPDASVNFTLTVTDQVVETPAAAVVAITEVAPWSSGNSPGVAADWFEVTNISDNPVTIAGWKVDDGSATFASSAALNGISTIAPGESVIFIETNDLSGKTTAFINTWFGGNAPSGLQIGSYTGSGLGLSTGGDGVNLFSGGGVLQASVTFGAADETSPYQTFDNTAALNAAAVTLLSEVGTNGAFVAATSAIEIGSPGYSAPGVLRITEVAPWSSGNSAVAADWFEVTNIGARAVNVTGWKMDDGSETPASAVALNGISSIAPGESVIFIETADLPGKSALFKTTWFGANPPAGLQIGSYSGGGVGLSTGGDAVNLFDTTSPTPVRRANVSFGIAPSSAPFGTFDNTAAADLASVTLKSVPGVNGAFVAANSTNEFGSPGSAIPGGPLDFALWLAANGYTSSGFGADGDNDGVTDGVEFFFNQNPNNGGDFGNMPQLFPHAGALALGFTRLTDTGSTTGTPEVSCDLETWTDALPGIDYTVANSLVNGDETTFTYALPGSGPSAPGTSATYLSPNSSDPVGASLGGVRVVNEGLVGVGRTSGNSLDSFGETQGAASGLFITDWAWDGNQFTGTFNVLPDRGYNAGSIFSNYAARLHEVDFTFTPYYGTTAVAQGQISPTYVSSTKFTYQDSATVKFTTGLDVTATGSLFGQSVGIATAANGPGGAQESLLSFDAEAVHLFEDGSGFVSDEYGTYIARFNAAKEITGITQLPESARPHSPVGTLNFKSTITPNNGRRQNQGLEGMSVTPDGTRLFAVMQSALVQDTGTGAQGRNNTRLFVYDVAGTNRETPVLIGEYVVKLPQIDSNGGTPALNATAAQSEIVALNGTAFLMLPRDGNGLGTGSANPIVFKSVQLVDFASATNILGTYDAEGNAITTSGNLKPGINAAAAAEVINMLNPTDLAKFGLNTNTATPDNNTLNEKMEGMALVPDLSTPQGNDFFLFLANDNDFQSSDVKMIDAAGNLVSYGDGRSDAGNGPLTNDAMFYAYRVTIDACGKKFFRFDIQE